MKKHICLTFLFGMLTLFAHTQDWNMYPYEPSGQIAFPLDEGRHIEDPTEWWYTSGHIVGETSGTNYSFMCTYFYNPAASFDGFRILNITNDDTGEFFQSVLPLTYTILSQTSCDIEASIFQGGIEYFRNKLDGNNNVIPFQYDLYSNGGVSALEISFTTTKRPLILSEDGYLEQGTANYTYYYSQTMNTISGSLTFNGVTENVSGTGWIDRQYGNFNPFLGEKYEWFSLQLSNGMDLNFWNIFTTDRTVPDNEKYRLLSAYVDEDNQYSTIDLAIERLEYFYIEDRCYSKKWRLTSPTNAIDLIIESLHTTTEVQLPFQFFEGSTVVSGTVNGMEVTGKGFAELLHTYQNPIMTFTGPVSTYDESMPITWTLDNPDEGRPVLFDLEYSIDNQENFSPIAQGLNTTSYTWGDSSLNSNDTVWFKVKSYSIDGVLMSEIISNALTVETLDLSNFSINTIKLYPNPVSDVLHVSLKNVQDTVAIRILDINGRLIKHHNFLNKEILNINTSSIQSGVYFVEVKGTAGKKVFRIIK